MDTPGEDAEVHVTATSDTHGQEPPPKLDSAGKTTPDTNDQGQPPNQETVETPPRTDTHGQGQPPNKETVLNIDHPPDIEESYICWLLPDKETDCRKVCKDTFCSIPCPQWLKRCCSKIWGLKGCKDCCGCCKDCYGCCEACYGFFPCPQWLKRCCNKIWGCKDCCVWLCKMCCRKCCISGIIVEENESLLPCTIERGNGRCCKCEEEPDEAKEEKEIQHGLQFHLKNPYQKWRDSTGLCPARCPSKLVLQVTAVILVTLQVVLFGTSRSALTQFVRSNTDTINTLFLDFGCEDSMTVHSMDSLYHQIQRIADTYYNITNIAVAPYDYFEDINATHPNDPPLLLVIVEQYNEWRFDASTHDIYLSPGTHTYDIPLYSGKNETCYPPGKCTVQAQLEPYVNVSSIGSIKQLTVPFQLTSFFIEHLDKFLYTSCVTFHVDILFHNDALSSTIPVEVKTEPTIKDCNASQKTQQFYNTVSTQLQWNIDISIITIMSLYSCVCLCSIVDSWILTCRTYGFFKKKYKKWLTYGDIMSLQPFWNYAVIIGNLLVIVGCVFNMKLADKDVQSVDQENWTAVILGLGVFFQWCGLLHFLNYFDKFNILLLTLQIAFPSVIRLVVCAGVLYVAFMLLGWLVLGPYHRNFADLSITSECLFSLLNGDDMFATYKEMSQTSKALWIFSKFYLYIFIALFIYVVLSVFIGLITETYETLTRSQAPSNSKGILDEFAQYGNSRLKYEEKMDATEPEANGLTNRNRSIQDQDQQSDERELLGSD